MSNTNHELAYILNTLAGTTNREATAAANVWAGTTGLELVHALNVKNGTVGVAKLEPVLDGAGNYLLDENGAIVYQEALVTADAMLEFTGVCNALAGTTGHEGVGALATMI